MTRESVPHTKSSSLASLLAAVLFVLLVLLALDITISGNRTHGRRRAALTQTAARLEQANHAKVLMLGVSTTRFWLGGGYLGRALGLPKGAVADGGNPGCYPDCTWALTKRLQQQQKTYDLVVYGINLFQMCEGPHSYRTLQHRSFLPTGSLPDLVALYASARSPMQHYARYLGAAASGAYEDTSALKTWLGTPLRMQRRRKALWYRPTPATKTVACDYNEADTAFAQKAIELLNGELAVLAPRSLILLLPDKSLQSPHYQRAWKHHRAFFNELALRNPHLDIIDLSRGGASTPDDFTDAVHVSEQGIEKQRRLFESKLSQLGLR